MNSIIRNQVNSRERMKMSPEVRQWQWEQIRKKIKDPNYIKFAIDGIGRAVAQKCEMEDDAIIMKK